MFSDIPGVCPMTADSPDQSSPEPGPVPLAKPGTRWTPEEEEILIAEVREGRDMTAIMEHHGRNRTGIEERLVMMVPEEAQVPDDEKLDWIVDRLIADPNYDWAAQIERTRLARNARRASRSLDHENALTRTPRLTEPGTVLDIWQHINRRELRDQRKAAFLTSKALYDLTAYETGPLTQIAERLYLARGTLLLNDWAAECASPGITSLAPADDLRLSLPLISEAVRVWVTALAAVVPYDGDRTILQRRLGLNGGDPETLQDIAEDLAVSRERIRQRQERAIKATAYVNVLPGYRSARDRAQEQLACLVTADDGIVEPRYLNAIIALSFPTVDNALVTRLIIHAAEHAGRPEIHENPMSGMILSVEQPADEAAAATGLPAPPEVKSPL
jgi:hypothetical protein